MSYSLWTFRPNFYTPKITHDKIVDTFGAVTFVEVNLSRICKQAHKHNEIAYARLQASYVKYFHSKGPLRVFEKRMGKYVQRT
jgi:hypothetical protein